MSGLSGISESWAAAIALGRLLGGALSTEGRPRGRPFPWGGEGRLREEGEREGERKGKI